MGKARAALPNEPIRRTSERKYKEREPKNKIGCRGGKAGGDKWSLCQSCECLVTCLGRVDKSKSEVNDDDEDEDESGEEEDDDE
ncbi:unnamed protein product [Prunus armeniaca]|uniref:Uncharacterized protein n=1 Tax=Prunus armeniaca TaxID=36596 RepID=A0A6J5W516_PRUAR|nr:unnamed protein product [Prunus armeniaca]